MEPDGLGAGNGGKNATTRDSGQTKEDLARAIAERDGITAGLVCVLAAVEAPVRVA